MALLELFPFFGAGIFFGCFQAYDVRTDMYCASIGDLYDRRGTIESQLIHVYGSNKAKYGKLFKDGFANDTIIKTLIVINALNDIEAGAFNGLENLSYLRLEHNNISLIRGKYT